MLDGMGKSGGCCTRTAADETGVHPKLKVEPTGRVGEAALHVETFSTGVGDDVADQVGAVGDGFVYNHKAGDGWRGGTRADVN